MNAEEVSECLELIDKLKKKKKGNATDLDGWKQMLTDDKNLHKSTVNYLKSLDGQVIPKSKTLSKKEKKI